MIRRRGEGGDSEGGEGLGEGVVVAGGSLIIQGEEAEDGDSARDEASGAGEDGAMRIVKERSLRGWSVMKVAHQQENGLFGGGDQLIAVIESPLEICPPAQMKSEEEVERVFGTRGEVDDFGVKSDEVGRECGKASEDRRIDPGIDGRGQHRRALIETDDDLSPGRSPPRPSKEASWKQDLAIWLVVSKVGLDRTRPIDLVGAARGARPRLSLSLLDGLLQRDR